MGLNFCDQQEAELFQRAVEEKINQRNNRQGQRGHGLTREQEKGTLCCTVFHAFAIDLQAAVLLMLFCLLGEQKPNSLMSLSAIFVSMK